ncbi:hybrid sensor histidine kinase/response regulator [Aquiflexum sp. TKW24L]|uniref:hybrid sensor histidine kinase/response regulator n=1 Tax=Aquiflexum sp. TKW24L TaxID=2942212 RepID=UPI0020C06F0F|nr:hybrid sensor histidine kinase/response regulator [Aquiflexum sp. TKW24L]MCL6260375.1 hybrid sensor histidine kinase/response regulator [Aquiflexum sp. TKW24L]
MTDKIIVLYIDDEDNNLNSFKASLRKEYRVITAIDAFEGLKIAEKEELHVVIADQRMPGLDGVEFFERLMKINPDPVRILLTGYSDIADVIDAINRGQVYKFIDKPWNIEQIRNAIKTAGDIYFARKELKDKNERLQKIHSEMNQFVYSLSHELRGPLMSISGVSKLAKMEAKDPSVLEYFDLIDTATDKLDEFIYKMLDFYRSTKIENKVSEIDFDEVVTQQLEIYRQKWDMEGIAINININQNSTFNSDDSKIRVILNNLFHNAVVFQKENSLGKFINVDINVADNIATIILEDNGVGIEDKLIDDVFNLFQRATQKNVGSGLGLYMVKESAIQMGGKVKLESTVDIGTKVTVTLPSLILD